MIWTTEREQELTDLWAAGRSASEIAREMEAPSRSAVMGKVRCMGLPFRAVSNRVARPRRPKMQTKPAAGNSKRINVSPFSFAIGVSLPPKPIKADEPLPGAKLVSFMDLEHHHCRYMHGDKFCGCKTIPGTSWCPDHYRVVYKPIEVSSRLPSPAKELEAA